MSERGSRQYPPAPRGRVDTIETPSGWTTADSDGMAWERHPRGRKQTNHTRVELVRGKLPSGGAMLQREIELVWWRCADSRNIVAVSPSELGFIWRKRNGLHNGGQNTHQAV